LRFLSVLLDLVVQERRPVRVDLGGRVAVENVLARADDDQPWTPDRRIVRSRWSAIA
jgi:hypothetical protein